MEELNEWLRVHGIKQKIFAKMVGVSDGCISYMLNGKREFSKPIALAIEHVTDGVVTYEMLRPGDEKYGTDVMARWRNLK